MLSATLHKLLLTYGSPVAKDIQQNIYVDNIISGFPNIDVATQYYLKARQIMSDAHFNLRSWASNHHSITALAQQDKVADSRITVNVLGWLWDTNTDTLMLNSKESLLSQHSPRMELWMLHPSQLPVWISLGHCMCNRTLKKQRHTFVCSCAPPPEPYIWKL